MAIIGVRGREGWEISNSWIFFVDSRPSITGIWMSIKTTSNMFSLKVSNACSPFSTAVISCPLFVNNFVAKVRFIVVSSANKIFSGGPRSCLFLAGVEF